MSVGQPRISQMYVSKSVIMSHKLNAADVIVTVAGISNVYNISADGLPLNQLGALALVAA